VAVRHGQAPDKRHPHRRASRRRHFFMTTQSRRHSTDLPRIGLWYARGEGCGASEVESQAWGDWSSGQERQKLCPSTVIQSRLLYWRDEVYDH